MNKSELVAAIAQEAKLTKADAEKALNGMITTITKQLKKNGNEAKVVIPGFFTVKKIKRSARKGRNPQNGKEIKIPEKKVAKFAAGSTLNAALN